MNTYRPADSPRGSAGSPAPRSPGGRSGTRRVAGSSRANREAATWYQRWTLTESAIVAGRNREYFRPGCQPGPVRNAACPNCPGHTFIVRACPAEALLAGYRHRSDGVSKVASWRREVRDSGGCGGPARPAAVVMRAVAEALRWSFIWQQSVSLGSLPDVAMDLPGQV